MSERHCSGQVMRGVHTALLFLHPAPPLSLIEGEEELSGHNGTLLGVKNMGLVEKLFFP